MEAKYQQSVLFADCLQQSEYLFAKKYANTYIRHWYGSTYIKTALHDIGSLSLSDPDKGMRQWHVFSIG